MTGPDTFPTTTNFDERASWTIPTAANAANGDRGYAGLLENIPGDTVTAVCGACGGRYHVVVRTDLPGKDCGDVSLNETYLALQYACFNCLGAGPASAPSADASHKSPEG